MDSQFLDYPASEELLATRSRMTQNPPLNSLRPDAGYLMKGWRRKLQGEGEKQKWCYTKDDSGDEQTLLEEPPGPDVPYQPPDIYEDKKAFPDGEPHITTTYYYS